MWPRAKGVRAFLTAFAWSVAAAACLRPQIALPIYAGTASTLWTCTRSGSVFTITDATTDTDCSTTGGSTHISTCLCKIGTGWVTITGSGGGTVTSVAASGPTGVVTWSGSPIATSGTLAATLDTQAANTVLAGPTSGSAATPAFRVLVDADVANATVAAPTDFSGLLIWLKADSLGLTDGTAVATWTDSSGTAHDFTQATAANRPTYKTSILNGMAVVRFDGTNDCLTNASVALSTFSIFAVFDATTSGFIYEHSADANSNDGSWLYTGSPVVAVRRTTNSSRDPATTNNVVANGMWHVALSAYDGTHQGNRLWLDGVYPGATNSGSGASTSTVTTAMFMGCRNNTASTLLGGDVAEFIVYTPRLTSTQEMSVARYLGAKYSLAGN